MRVVSFVVILLSLVYVAFAISADDKAYSPAERRRNEMLEKLGLPPDPPKTEGSDPMQAPAFEEEYKMRPFASHEKHYASKGYIGVHEESIDGPLLGYLDCHKLVPTKEDAILYAFITGGPVMEIRVVGTRERMAVTAGPGGVDLNPYSHNFHLPRHTRFSSIPGAGPSHDKEQAFLYESSVFSHLPDGDEIEVQWVNLNGQYSTTQIVVMDNRVYYTGDTGAFRAYTKRKVVRVVFRWYPSE